MKNCSYFRVAAFQGAIKQIITTEKSSDIFNKKTITASRGTVFNIQRDDYIDGLAAVQALGRPRTLRTVTHFYLA